MYLKTKFNLSSLFVLLFAGLTFVGCKKDDATPDITPNEPVVTTVVEDKANIQKTVDDMLVCVEDMTSARAIDVLLRDFMNMSEGNVYNEDWNTDLNEKFQNVFDFTHIEENNRFNLTHHAGMYSYDHSTSNWSKSATTDNKVTVQFPSSPDKSLNDATIVIDNYVDQAITIDGEQIFAPKNIHAQMDVDGVKLLELNLTNVIYDANSTFEIPVEMDFSLFMDPMTIDLDLVRNSNTEFNVMLAFNDGSACDMSVEVDLTLADDDFENLNEDSVEKVHAKVRLGDMTVQSLAGLAEYWTLEDPSASETNSLLDLDVLFDDIKIADMEYDDAEENFIIHYKDASTESAANYFDSFMEDLEALVIEFTGEW